MSFMKKNVNLILLFLILLLSCSIAFIGVYYAENYTSLSSRYNNQVESLQKVTNDLLFHKSILNQTASDLIVKSQDETELNKKYNDLRDYKDKIEAENANLKKDVETRNAEIVTKTNQMIANEGEIAGLKNDVESYKSQVNTLDARIRGLNSKIRQLCTGDLSSC